MTDNFIAQPLHNLVFIRQVELVNNSSGLILPGDSEQTQAVAEVIAVGPGRYVGDQLVPVCVKPGDLVLIGGSFNLVKLAEEEFIPVSENSLMGIVDRSQVQIKESKDEPASSILAV